MKDVEIEIKVRVRGVDRLIKFLKVEAKLKYEQYQKDEYFNPAHRDFTHEQPIREWLRLRTSDTDSITYKDWKYNDQGIANHCDEYETTLGSSEQVRKILIALDMQPAIVVEKQRQAWDYQDYEIAIDVVTDLGDFVEIEYRGGRADVDPEQVVADMVELLRQAGCSDIERNYQGYPHMLLYPDQTKFEPL